MLKQLLTQIQIEKSPRTRGERSSPPVDAVVEALVTGRTLRNAKSKDGARNGSMASCTPSAPSPPISRTRWRSPLSPKPGWATFVTRH